MGPEGGTQCSLWSLLHNLLSNRPWLYRFEFKVKYIVSLAPFITFNLSRIILFLHPDLEKPQTAGSARYLLGGKGNVGGLGVGERRDIDPSLLPPSKEEGDQLSLGRIHSKGESYLGKQCTLLRPKALPIISLMCSSNKAVGQGLLRTLRSAVVFWGSSTSCARDAESDFSKYPLRLHLNLRKEVEDRDYCFFFSFKAFVFLKVILQSV